MIVVATEDFELYHDVVSELRNRGVQFTTMEPGTELPEETTVVLVGEDDSVDLPAGMDVVEGSAENPRAAVEAVIASLRGDDGRTIVGIDPGEQPGIAVLTGDMIVATFQVPPERVADVVHEEIADAPNPLIRIGDGARLIGTRIVDELDDVPVELVDETGTTPYLGTGVRGLGDVLAAVNIARIEGEEIDSREIEPTAGEIKRIQEQSREQSDENRTIDGKLARQVALGELTVREALDEHRD
ncbi:hypothetical protein [Halobacteriaceae bacterium SHR40]|uniref:hypothetical protein n=1 Tax=Halovenus amylolytica TaxID=2500550 RepID=UPI000FE2F267